MGIGYTVNDMLGQINIYGTKFVILALATYAFGFWQYLTSMYMQIRNKECPFFFWMHCWYFGHDLTFSLLFKQWFSVMNFWLFKVMCIACMVFVGIEIVSFVYAVKYERQSIWGHYRRAGAEVTLKEGIIRGVFGYAMGVAIFMTIRILIGDSCCLFLMMSTNATLAMFLQFRLEEMGEVQKGTRPLGWATLLGTILTFCPRGVGFFATAVPNLHQPAFYVVGAVCIICALRHMYLAYTMPLSKELADNPKTFKKFVKA